MCYRYLYCVSIWALLVVLCSSAQTLGKGNEGKLAVIITYGDVTNTPARNVYVHVRGYLPSYPEEISLTLDATRDGNYERALAPGLYDVFVSEGSSVPRCKRVEVKAKETKVWMLKLEIDDANLEKN